MSERASALFKNGAGRLLFQYNNQTLFPAGRLQKSKTPFHQKSWQPINRNVLRTKLRPRSRNTVKLILKKPAYTQKTRLALSAFELAFYQMRYKPLDKLPHTNYNKFQNTLVASIGSRYINVHSALQGQAPITPLALVIRHANAMPNIRVALRSIIRKAHFKLGLRPKPKGDEIKCHIQKKLNTHKKMIE